MKSFRFNPAFHSDEQAIQNFIVRQRELGFILERLSTDEPGDQRILVIAPRGAGKTTLCRRVLAEVRSSLFHRRWTPIFLGEESYSVTTPGEFLLECLYHLANDPLAPMALSEHERALQIGDDEALKIYCQETFRRLVSQTGKRFLIIVENLHMILNDQIGKDDVELVELLSDDSLFGVLATSVKSDGFEGRDSLLRAFAHLTLEPLALEECHSLWTALTGQEVERSRIRPLQILTGGSPRLIHILADFMKTPSLRDLMENLNFLIDENTEYFKSQLDALPSVERKVFVALLEAWDPSTAKQVADAARVGVNVASAMLARLTERGAVIKQPGTGRAALYHAAERLFNIYYLMRRRSHPSNRVRALVAFMTQYYDQDELVDTTAMLALEACRVEPSGRADYHSAFAAILKGQPDSVRAKILQRTPADFRRSLAQDRAIRHFYPAKSKRKGKRQRPDLLERARQALSAGKPDEGRRLIEQAITSDKQAFQPWVTLAFLEAGQDRNEEAIEAALEAVSRAEDNPLTHTVLGIMLKQGSRTAAAEKAFERALELSPNLQLPLVELARIRHDEDRDDEAVTLFERAAEQGELPDDDAIGRYGHLIAARGDRKRAERILREALASDEDRPLTRRILAKWLVAWDRVDAAEGLLSEAAERSSEWYPWVDYASFQLQVMHDPALTMSIVQSALGRGLRSPPLYRLLAQASSELGFKSDQLHAIARQVVAENGRTDTALVVQGEIFQMTGEVDKAEAAFRAAIEIDPLDTYALGLLGRLLASQSGKAAQAEKTLRRLIEIHGDDSFCGPLKDLAETRIHRGDDVEATELLERALAANDHCECSLVLRADVARRTGDGAKAVDLLTKALALNPTSIPALTTLARIADQDAEALIHRAIEADPDDPRALLARSRLTSRDLRKRIADAATALEKDPDLVEAHIELASLHAQQGDGGHATEHLADALRAVPLKMEIIPAFVNAALNLVSAGYLDEVIELLSGEQGRAVEPLAVALRSYRGETPVVAKEIQEVAMDIVSQLSRRLSRPGVTADSAKT